MERSLMLFAVVYKRGPTWNAGVDFREQNGIEHHVGFLQLQHTAGRLRLGGPFLDNTGGIALFEADDAAALEQTLTTDATIESRLMTFELHPLVIAFADDGHRESAGSDSGSPEPSRASIEPVPDSIATPPPSRNHLQQ